MHNIPLKYYIQFLSLPQKHIGKTQESEGKARSCEVWNNFPTKINRIGLVLKNKSTEGGITETIKNTHEWCKGNAWGITVNFFLAIWELKENKPKEDLF